MVKTRRTPALADARRKRSEAERKKERRISAALSCCSNELEAALILTLCIEAGAAVNRAISTGLEGHLSGAAAAIADYFVHLALATTLTAVGSTAGSTASGAAAGLVLEALFRVESLLGSSEYEVVTALAALKSLVLIHS